MSYTLHAVAPMAPAVVYHQPQHQMYGTGYPQMVMPPMSQMSHHPQPMYVPPTFDVSKLMSRMYSMPPQDPFMQSFPPPPHHQQQNQNPNPHNQPPHNPYNP